MPRITGHLRPIEHEGQPAQAFVPLPLPPAEPPLLIEGELAQLHADALAAIGALNIAADLVPDADWFLYGFARKEAVVSSMIEGTQATLRDVLTFEATESAPNPDDVEEVCNYVKAIARTRASIKNGPITTGLLFAAHATLMHGVRGADKNPGAVRTTQNWIAGRTPADALFVPPPPEEVPAALAELESWLAQDDPLPPLVRTGLAHAQFVTIHPFDDGNGRIGRLLIALLLESWGVCDPCLLFISSAFRRDQLSYSGALTRTREAGDWEHWTKFFLRCVRSAAEEAVEIARSLAQQVDTDRKRLLAHDEATVSAIRLFESLPRHPVMTSQRAAGLLGVSAPTANKAIAALIAGGVLIEQTGKQRDREYAYHEYLRILTGDDEAH